MVTGLKYLWRNALSNAIGIVAPAIAWVIAVPILVHQLGEQGYGVFTIAISFAGMLGFLELGLTSAATKFIADVRIRSDKNQIEQILSTNLLLYLGIGSVVTLLCFVFTPGIAQLLFKDAGIDPAALSLVVRSIGILFTLTLLKNALASILMGLHRYDIYNVIQIIYAALLALVQVVIVLRGGSVLQLMLGNILVTGISLIGFTLAIHFLIPGVRFLRVPESYFARALFSFGMFMMLINLEGAILYNVDKIVIGRLLGLESVTYYSIPTQICFKVHSGLALFISFIFPLTSEVQSMGDRATLKRIFLDGMKTITFIDGTAMVFLGAFAPEILSFWIGAEFAGIAAPILIFTALGYLLFALSITPYHFLLGMGHPKEFAVLNLLATASVIAGLTLGIAHSGLTGGAIGAAVGMGAMVTLPWFVQRKLDIGWGETFRGSYGRNVLLSIGGIGLGAILPASIPIKLAFFGVYVLILLLFGNMKWGEASLLIKKPFYHRTQRAQRHIKEVL
jgi:O-antigen/teichoic acid export membrane protein